MHPQSLFLRPALSRIEERCISEEEARSTLEELDLEYPGYLGRIVAEKVLPSKRLATKVAYNLGPGGTRIVVTFERGIPTGGEPR